MWNPMFVAIVVCFIRRCCEDAFLLEDDVFFGIL